MANRVIAVSMRLCTVTLSRKGRGAEKLAKEIALSSLQHYTAIARDCLYAYYAVLVGPARGAAVVSTFVACAASVDGSALYLKIGTER